MAVCIIIRAIELKSPKSYLTPDVSGYIGYNYAYIK